MSVIRHFPPGPVGAVSNRTGFRQEITELNSETSFRLRVYDVLQARFETAPARGLRKSYPFPTVYRSYFWMSILRVAVKSPAVSV